MHLIVKVLRLLLCWSVYGIEKFLWFFQWMLQYWIGMHIKFLNMRLFFKYLIKGEAWMIMSWMKGSEVLDVGFKVGVIIFIIECFVFVRFKDFCFVAKKVIIVMIRMMGLCHGTFFPLFPYRIYNLFLYFLLILLWIHSSFIFFDESTIATYFTVLLVLELASWIYRSEC